MIVKIQRPLAGNAPPRALIYNEDRSFHTTAPMSDELLKLMGEQPKIYAEIQMDNGNIVLVRVVDPQPW